MMINVCLMTMIDLQTILSYIYIHIYICIHTHTHVLVYVYVCFTQFSVRLMRLRMADRVQQQIAQDTVRFEELGSEEL